MNAMIEQLPTITSHAELRQRIAKLEALKEQQEEVLKKNLTEVYKSLQPAELLKNAVTKDAAALAGGGMNFILKKVLRNSSLVGMIASLIAGEVMGAMSNKYQDKIQGFVGKAMDKVLTVLRTEKPGEDKKA